MWWKSNRREHVRSGPGGILWQMKFLILAPLRLFNERKPQHKSICNHSVCLYVFNDSESQAGTSPAHPLWLAAPSPCVTPAHEKACGGRTQACQTMMGHKTVCLWESRFLYVSLVPERQQGTGVYSDLKQTNNMAAWLGRTGLYWGMPTPKNQRGPGFCRQTRRQWALTDTHTHTHCATTQSGSISPHVAFYCAIIKAPLNQKWLPIKGGNCGQGLRCLHDKGCVCV